MVYWVGFSAMPENHQFMMQTQISGPLAATKCLNIKQWTVQMLSCYPCFSLSVISECFKAMKCLIWPVSSLFHAALLPVGLVSISGKWRGSEKERGKNSCLVNPLLSRIYQKSSFHSTVCVGSTLNPLLHNLFCWLRFSCTNKHGNGSPQI